jgi:hypothetical protein
MKGSEYEKLGWGKSVVETLANDLQKEFPGLNGFSTRNIWYMRNFFAFYSQNTKLQPLVAEIGWTHNLVIMEKCFSDQIEKLEPSRHQQIQDHFVDSHEMIDFGKSSIENHFVDMHEMVALGSGAKRELEVRAKYLLTLVDTLLNVIKAYRPSLCLTCSNVAGFSFSRVKNAI